MKDKEKQIEEMCNEIINIQKEKRTEYCIRLQKAFEYKGNNDHEDIPSILKDYEHLIMNRYFIDSVVLSREEYEKYQNLKRDIEYSFEYNQGYIDGQIKGSKETAEKFVNFVNCVVEYELKRTPQKQRIILTRIANQVQKLAKQLGVEIKG